jgi:hypothetical protein
LNEAILCGECGHYELTPESKACIREELTDEDKAKLAVYVKQKYDRNSGKTVLIRPQDIKRITKRECKKVPRPTDFEIN